MSNEILVKAIQSGDNSRMSDLWENCLDLIHRIANKYRSYTDPEDLTQESFFILCQCVDRYDPEAGALFSSYLAASLDGYYKRIIAKQSGLSVNMYSRVVKYNQHVEAFRHEHGREPSTEESAEALNVTADEIRRIQTAAIMNTPASLDDEISDADGLTLADMITDETDPADTVTEAVQVEELRAVLWPMVDELDDQERDIITRRYRGNEKPKDIGNETGLTSTQVHSLETRGIMELRRPRNRKKLEPFVEEYITSHLFRSAGKSESETERIALWLYDKAPQVDAADL